jgi:hypothetical protein
VLQTLSALSERCPLNIPLVQVANFDLTEAEAEEVAKDESLTAPASSSLTGAKLWESILADQYGLVKEQELASMGRGRRTRKPVNYKEDALHDDKGDATASKQVATANPAANEAAGLDRAGHGGAARAQAELCASTRPGKRRRDELVDADWVPEAGESEQMPLHCEGNPLSTEWKVQGLTSMARQQFLAFLLKFGLPLKDSLAWDWGAPALLQMLWT